MRPALFAPPAHRASHPLPLSSSTLVPDLIGDPVKKWIQSSKGSSVVAFAFSLRPPAIPCRPLMAPQGATAPRSRIRCGGEDCLSKASSAAQQLGPGQRHPKGHARAPMVLGPFAETKGPRRGGPKPRKPLLFPSCHPRPDRGSSVVLFAFGLSPTLPRERASPALPRVPKIVDE